MFVDDLVERSPRDLQLYASKLLHTYCEAKTIQHFAIDELITHLNDYPEASGLADWERKGALLSLSGRGDEVPVDLVKLIPCREIDEFTQMVECAVEVGMVDMYGASTGQAVKFIEIMRCLLSRAKIDIAFP